MLHATTKREEQRPLVTQPFDLAIEDHLDDAAALSLWQQADTASVFNHPAWWRAARDCIAPDRRLLTVAARVDGTLCGYWPFWEKRLGAKDAFVHVLEPIGSRHIDYVMPLVRKGFNQPALVSAMLDTLGGRLSVWTLLLWPKADRIGLADETVAKAFAHKRHLVHRHLRPCPRMTLAETYGALEARWSRNHRSQVRRRIKKLDTAGSIEFFVAPTREQVLSRLPTLFDMHQANWLARGGGSEFEDEANMRFVEQLARRLPFENLHYSEVRVDGAPVSCHLGFLNGRDILWYKPAFDLAFAQYSPGMVHIARLANWGIENEFAALDFMQGDEPYKLSWADDVAETVSHAVSGPQALPVWAWNTKLRNLIVEFKA